MWLSSGMHSIPYNNVFLRIMFDKYCRPYSFVNYSCSVVIQSVLFYFGYIVWFSHFQYRFCIPTCKGAFVCTSFPALLNYTNGEQRRRLGLLRVLKLELILIKIVNLFTAKTLNRCKIQSRTKSTFLHCCTKQSIDRS